MPTASTTLSLSSWDLPLLVSNVRFIHACENTRNNSSPRKREKCDKVRFLLSIGCGGAKSAPKGGREFASPSKSEEVLVLENTIVF